MAKISLKPIVVLVRKTKAKLEKARKVADVAERKALDTRIAALGKAEAYIESSCKGGKPPLSVVVLGGKG